MSKALNLKYSKRQGARVKNGNKEARKMKWWLSPVSIKAKVEVLICLFYLFNGFYITFNTAQVISQWLFCEQRKSVHTVGQGSV